MSKEEIIARFSEGDLPPAEDNIWYQILAIDSDDVSHIFETEILGILTQRGYDVCVKDVPDSFGRSIYVDNVLMCCSM